MPAADAWIYWIYLLFALDDLLFAFFMAEVIILILFSLLYNIFYLVLASHLWLPGFSPDKLITTSAPSITSASLYIYL